MDPIPLPSPEDTQDQFMPASRPELEQAMAHAIQHKSLPQYLKTKDARRAFQSAFELIGGIPRLALWADSNPTQFYQIYARFLDKPSGGDTQPQLHLHLSWMKGRGLVQDVEASDVRTEPDSDN